MPAERRRARASTKTFLEVCCRPCITITLSFSTFILFIAPVPPIRIPRDNSIHLAHHVCIEISVSVI